MIRKDDSGNSLSESEAGSPDAIFQEETSSLVLLLVPGVFALGGGPHQRTERSQWLRSCPQPGPRPPTPTDGLEQCHRLAEKHSPSLRHRANSARSLGASICVNSSHVHFHCRLLACYGNTFTHLRSISHICHNLSLSLVACPDGVGRAVWTVSCVDHVARESHCFPSLTEPGDHGS